MACQFITWLLEPLDKFVDCYLRQQKEASPDKLKQLGNNY